MSTALASLYRQLGGEVAWSAFHELVGLAPRTRAPTEASSPVELVRQLVYTETRAIDLVALGSGARDVTKFEDLTAERAAELEGDLRARGLHVLRFGPYTKHFDLAMTSDAPTRGKELFNVVASRGSIAGARAVADAERDRSPAGTRAAGRALGYPECCIEHFIEVAASRLAHEWGVNEAAVRSWDEAPIPWQANPLSLHSPIGFTACSARCPRALAFAERLLAPLPARELETVRQVLSRPILFFRYPLFFVLDGESTPRGVRYRRALLNDDGTDAAPGLHAIAQAEIGSVLAMGDFVELGSESLVVRRGAEEVGRWAVVDRRVPRLFRFG